MTPTTPPHRIGYYIHHHGAGHLTRATQIAHALRQPVTGLSSLPAPPDWPGEWIDLDRDDRPPHSTDPEETAGGVLHWAPLHNDGYRNRMHTIAAWAEHTHPHAVITDVSVEVTLLLRLLGIPVIVAAMRGDRTDRAHQAAYDLASALLAPWPGTLPEPDWPPRWRHKTAHVGGLSRFDQPENTSRTGPTEQPPTPATTHPPTSHDLTIGVLWGTGGQSWTQADQDQAAAATPHTRWTRPTDPDAVWPMLRTADIVVTHAGQNAVAEVAAARKPAVVISTPRPHGEQDATLAALDRAGLAATHRGIPEAHRWPELLEQARHIPGERWTTWSDGHGARRAAALAHTIASGRRIIGGLAVITLVSGRHEHLRRQIAGLLAGTHLPEHHILVAIDDPTVPDTAATATLGSDTATLHPTIVHIPRDDTGRLPLAAARNTGARRARDTGCTDAIFLDVDCIPSTELVARYAHALHQDPDENTPRPTIWAGPVTYLPADALTPGDNADPATLLRHRSPHPARPDPPPGTATAADDLRLFWSLSFATRLDDYDRLGGFCTDYTGYGGEDTDFAMTLQAAGGHLMWLGGADAYHQHHTVTDPPTEHLTDIVRNANLFATRWGWHPMQGWLEAFAAAGLAHFDPTHHEWRTTTGNGP
ncbi:Glycosyltransferase, GT2 family [Austwickia chelonae]|uniref:Glycosyltransferase n=1 Tax=Austwickia chelonae NBRC 105200 TaxID=1184607 RepID=K6W7Q9_9MICO|nr:glycosyltransferase family 2 protein [Austwickia chelonae]GAB77867.1 hypothetical protein AUCHE_08_01090 [Austwickia chelonae NBRC 105200]SEV91161.1 Glycosyltransferase, GT2 family [Austwickia chelonae]